jgi:hypothetical protein
MSTSILTMGRLNPPAHRIMALARAEGGAATTQPHRVAGVAAAAVSGLARPANAVPAVVLPAPVVYGFKTLAGTAGPGGAGAAFLTGLTAFALLFAVY